MRTTVTLDGDTEQIVRRRMREEGVSFKQALNDAIRRGAQDLVPFETATVSMGRLRLDLDRALQLSAELDDGGLSRRIRSGS